VYEKFDIFIFIKKTFGQAIKSEIQMGNSSGRGSQAGREVIFAKGKEKSEQIICDSRDAKRRILLSSVPQ